MKKVIPIAVIALLTVFFSSCTETKLPPSNAISNYQSFNLVNSTYTVIADLASINSDHLNHQITISDSGRIMACAQVNIKNPGGIAVRGSCQLFISDGTGPSNGLTAPNRPAVWYTTENAAYDLTVPVVGYWVKPPGTYNVVVKCQQLAAAGSTTGMLDNMVVWEGSK